MGQRRAGCAKRRACLMLAVAARKGIMACRSSKGRYLSSAERRPITSGAGLPASLHAAPVTSHAKVRSEGWLWLTHRLNATSEICKSITPCSLTSNWCASASLSMRASHSSLFTAGSASRAPRLRPPLHVCENA